MFIVNSVQSRMLMRKNVNNDISKHFHIHVHVHVKVISKHLPKPENPIIASIEADESLSILKSPNRNNFH